MIKRTYGLLPPPIIFINFISLDYSNTIGQTFIKQTGSPPGCKKYQRFGFFHLLELEPFQENQTSRGVQMDKSIYILLSITGMDKVKY